MRIVLALALAIGTVGSAHAADRTGYQAISAGDYASAEKALLAERRVFPRRPELMINLATVYARTGRLSQAAALYRAALDEDQVEMLLPSDSVESSHVVAQRGLDSLGPVTLAVR